MATYWECIESPESGRFIPTAFTCWHHPDPSDPEAVEHARRFRGFIRQQRMHEHMRHYLTGPDGERTAFELTGEVGRFVNHPLDGALLDPDRPPLQPGEPGHEIPVLDPVHPSLGHDFVSAEHGTWVLVAQPLHQRLTSVDTILRMSPSDFGMARFELRFDAAAAEMFAKDGRQEWIDRVNAEPDPALRAGLQFIFGVDRPDGRLRHL